MSFKKFATMSLGAVALLMGSNAKAQQVIVYLPYSASDSMTASASEPITLPVKRYPTNTHPSLIPAADTIKSKIIGKDTDEYSEVGSTPLQKIKQNTVTLTCTAISVDYQPLSGPVLRGIQPDGSFIWDFIYTGVRMPNTWPSAPFTLPTRVFVNKYRVDDGDTIQQIKDVPINLSQTIEIPPISQITP